MKLSRKFVFAAVTTVLVLAFSSCSQGNDASGVSSEEQAVMVSYSETYAKNSRATVLASEEAKKHPEMVNNPQVDSGLFGTWMSGYYTDVVHFSNDACFGRVSLENLLSGMISEGGIYCTENGEIKVLTYVVSNGSDDENIQITYKTYPYSIKKGKLYLNGKTFSRIR